MAINISPGPTRISSIKSLYHRYVAAGRWAVMLFAAGLIAVFAWTQLFSTFPFWDDEGYFLQAYRDFLSGRVLYDQVFAMYGPWTFVSAALLAGFKASNVTHDALRWIALPVWIMVAALLAGVIWRWTGRFMVSVAVFLLIGIHLSGIAKGLGHPQLWIILAAAVLLWLGSDWVTLSGREWPAFWSGVVIGSILLFKINIGGFVCIALALAVSLHWKGRLRNSVLGVLAVAAAGLGVALFSATSAVSEKYFALVYLASLAITIGVALAHPSQEHPSKTNLMRFAAGLGLCLCLGVVLTLAFGTTLRGLFGALVTGPALLVRTYHYVFTEASGKWSFLISALGLVTAAGVFEWRRLFEAHPSLLGLLKFAAGAGLLFAFGYDHRTALTGSLLFLWLLIVDVPPLAGPAYSNRLLLALLSPLFSLQLFPMAGEQVDWAALMPMTAAGVLLADGINNLAAADLRVPLPRRAGFTGNAFGALLVVFVCMFAGARTWASVDQWRREKPVDLPGAHWLRLPRKRVARFRTVVAAVDQNCQTLLTLPGMYSLSVWSGVPPFEERRFNSWPFLWQDEVQKEVLPKLRKQKQGCVLVSQKDYDFFKGIAISPGNDELLFEIQRTMTPIFTKQTYTLYRSWPEPEALPNAGGR
jgi:hypothetical protein